MHIPLIEKLKSIPGAVGIRLEEELPYEVEKKIGDLEIRNYRPFTLARTRATGNFKSASETCFRALAEFIFGENTDRKVTEMTTPIFYDRVGDEWIMSFYLPEGMEDLIPTSSDVMIEHMPAKKVAAFRFSGKFTEESMVMSESTLRSELRKANLSPDSHVWWAQFDQPVSIPLTKRNEALVKIQMVA